VAELDAVWITAGREAPLPGYACVVSKPHVVEPFELADELFRPTKMNYEIHGNTIPHLHVHLYPRFDGDPYRNGPIDPRRHTFTRSNEELERLRAALAAG
jgi:diadenosine tetraphosphate (Ap4A) HIT family hydrolase